MQLTDMPILKTWEEILEHHWISFKAACDVMNYDKKMSKDKWLDYVLHDMQRRYHVEFPYD